MVLVNRVTRRVYSARFEFVRGISFDLGFRDGELEKRMQFLVLLTVKVCARRAHSVPPQLLIPTQVYLTFRT